VIGVEAAMLWGMLGAVLAEVAEAVRAARDGTTDNYSDGSFLAGIVGRIAMGAGATFALSNFDIACSAVNSFAVGAAAPFFLFDRLIDGLFPPRSDQ
jgi:hypothetical protein